MERRDTPEGSSPAGDEPSAAEAGHLSLPPGTVLGRYTLKRKLGEGGMGAVFEAVHVDLGRRVAVKTLHPSYAASQDVRKRFLREGQAASKIHHSNVVDVYDVAVEGEVPFLVMELLEGEDLAALIAREGALEAGRVADLLIPVFAAVAAAHDLGIVHRDLKPENIFLSRDRGATLPKVVDFGISKILDDQAGNLTATSAMLGTPYYMSPEQAAAEKDLDTRSDQFSLGVILYECLTGERPFKGANIYALISAIIVGKFTHPRAVVPELPFNLDAMIIRAMSKDPGARFADVREMGRALLEFASDRTRMLYSNELSGSEAVAVAPAPSSPRGEFDETVPATDSGLRGTTLGRSTAEVSSAAASSSSRPWVVPAALAAVAVAAGVWFAERGEPVPEPNAPSTEPAAPPVLPPSPTAVPAPEAAVRKMLVTTPPGADVMIDGKRAGATPYAVEIPAGVDEVRATIHLSGYPDRTRSVARTDPDEISVILEPSIVPPAKRRLPPAGGGVGPPAAPKLAPR